MSLKIGIYYGIAALALLAWLVANIVGLMHGQTPDAAAQSLMIGVASHFFTKAKAGPFIEKQIKENRPGQSE